jgi:hypothetical protein
VEGTVLQVVSIAVAGVAALTATRAVSNLFFEISKMIATMRRTQQLMKQTRPTRKIRRIKKEEEIHKQFLHMQHLLKEGKSEEAEQIFRRAKPPGV